MRQLKRLSVSAFGFLAWILATTAPGQAAPKTWIGSQKAAVLLVEWSDTKSAHPPSEVEKVFFGDQVGSVKQFFRENSLGKFNLSGKVFAWQRSPLKWNSSRGCDLTWIVNEAWRMAGPSFPIQDFDSDHDGKIDHLFIVHSGRIPQDRVGPDCMFTSSKMANSTIVFQSEGVGSIGGSIPIGFYIHESGHQYFSFPDLYSDHYHGKYGIGMWGMMGLGAWGTNAKIPRDDMFKVPAHFEPASKVKIGWITPKILSSSQTGLKLRPVELSGDILVIPLKNHSSYYLEYRSKNGFSRGHEGQGLMIWKDFTLIQADGRDDLNHGRDLGRRPIPPIDENFGDASDPFPGSLGVTEFNDPQNGISIHNIRQTADGIEFDLTLREAVQAPFTQAFLPKFDGQERLR